MLAGRGVEQRGVDAGLDVAGQQGVEDRARIGLELEVGRDACGVDALAVAAGDGLAVERHQRTLDDFLRTGGDEAGVDELDPVDLAAHVNMLHDALADLLGVLVRGVVAEAAVGGADACSRGSGSSPRPCDPRRSTV